MYSQKTNTKNVVEFDKNANSARCFGISFLCCISIEFLFRDNRSLRFLCAASVGALFVFWGMVLLFNAYTVSFFGHRYIENPLSLQNILEKLIEKIIDENEYVDFLVGRNGDFDIIASSAVRRVHKNHRDDNSSLILTLPYNTAEYKNNKQYFEEYYNDVRISFSAELAHPKSAIEKRNFEMIDMSDLIIFYVTNTHGGAYKALKYAEKSGKNIINIAKIDII